MRTGLLLSSVGLVLFVSGVLLATSLIGTRQLAERVAEPQIRATSNALNARLQDLFGPIQRHLVSDIAAIKTGALDPSDADDTTHYFIPVMLPLDQIGSLMIGNPAGRQFLIMRYTSNVRQTPLLSSISPALPTPLDEYHQFFTREVRPMSWGERSSWTLWDHDAQEVLRRWELPLPGYDPRDRPWHRVAMANFKERSLSETIEAGKEVVNWTDVYTFFTTKEPGVSASAAVRDPAGELHIVAYDLLLSQVAEFVKTAVPSTHGRVYVLTGDDRVLAAPADSPGHTLPVLASLRELDDDPLRQAQTMWNLRSNSAASNFRVIANGQAWWAGFAAYSYSENQKLWIAVLIPESDLVPLAERSQFMIVVVGLIAVAMAVLASLVLSRRFVRPIEELVANSQRVAQMEWDEPRQPLTRIKEFASLARAQAEMRDALHAHLKARDDALRLAAMREQQVRSLAENSPDMILRFDSATRYQFVNTAFERITGWTSAQVIGRSLEAMPAPTQLINLWRDSLQQAMDTGLPQSFEFTLETTNGRATFSSRVIPERGHGNSPETVLVIAHDITHRVQAEAALRASEQRYRSLIESPLNGVIVLQEGKLVFANLAAIRLGGYEPSDTLPLGSTVEQLVEDPQLISDFRERVAAISRGESVPVHPPWQMRRRDGSKRWVQSSIAKVEWEGSPAVVLFLIDVHAQQEAASQHAELEEQLRQAQKLEAVGLLAGGVAHDFNNLLQVIQGNASLIEHDAGLTEMSQERLTSIHTTVKRAGQLTRQLLAFSRRQTLNREHLDANALTIDHMEMVRRLMPEGITFEFIPAETDVSIFADRGLIEQVLLNLCVNARDAMAGGGVLTLQLEYTTFTRATLMAGGMVDPGDYVRLSVRDTGCGMTEETMARVFEPFFSTKTHDKGTGLGLSVAYGIVKQHHGFFDMISSPGQGTTMVVLLPYVPFPADSLPDAATITQADAKLTPPTKRVVGKKRSTILLAEDEEPVRDLAARLLEIAGFNVIPAVDGDDAVNIFCKRAGEIDLLFFDVMMPGRNGIEAAEACLAQRPGVPVILTSGYAADSIRSQSPLDLNIPILPKPYEFIDLVRRIEAAL